MKTPSVLTLVRRMLKKLKENPYLGNCACVQLRNTLFPSMIALLNSIPEGSKTRKSKTFKECIKNLFLEELSYTSQPEYSEPFFNYLEPTFFIETILQSRKIRDQYKGVWLSKEVVDAYYEQQAMNEKEFRLNDYKMGEWFDSLSMKKREEIHYQRLRLFSERRHSMLTDCKKPEIFQLLAQKVEETKDWNFWFPHVETFDPKSKEGKSVQKLAQHFNPELWILYEITSKKIEEEKEDEAKGKVLFKINLIRQYFGYVPIPQREIRLMIDQALSDNNFKKMEFLISFLE